MRADHVFVLFLLVAGGAYGQVNIALEAGVGNNVPQNGMWAARVVVQNEGEQLVDGRVIFALHDTIGSAPSVVSETAVELPARSGKVVYTYLMAPASAATLKARYENERGRALAESEVHLTQLSTELPVVLGIGRPPAGLPPTSRGEDQIFYALSMPGENLPPDVEGLLPYDAIVFSPPPYQSLPRLQAEALRNWVLQGGVLLVDASRRTDFFQDGLFASWLPYIPQSGQQGQLPGFDEAVAYTTGTHRAGEVLLSAGELPAVIRQSVGLGAVIMFSVEPEAAAAAYEGSQDLWQVLLGHLPLWAQAENQVLAMNFRGTEHAIRGALTSSLTQGPASSVRLGLVILLTALYALAVGPGDYWLVKRLGKPKLTWVTFPLIVAGFTVAAYAGARYYVGGQLSAAAQERLAVFPDSNSAHRTTVYSVFSPAGRDYRVALAGGGRVMPAMVDPQPGDPEIRIDAQGAWVEERIPIWTRSNYFSARTESMPPELSVELTEQDGHAIATVTNNSNHTLVRHAIAYGQAFFAQGDHPLGPGETHSFDLGPLEVLDRNDVRPWTPQDWQETPRLGSEMAIVNRGPTPPIGGMRAFNLRPALDRGAVVWLSRSVEPVERPVEVNGDELDTLAPVAIQVVSYEGVQL
jgi:hypothetical protein